MTEEQLKESLEEFYKEPKAPDEIDLHVDSFKNLLKKEFNLKFTRPKTFQIVFLREAGYKYILTRKMFGTGYQIAIVAESINDVDYEFTIEEIIQINKGYLPFKEPIEKSLREDI